MLAECRWVLGMPHRLWHAASTHRCDCGGPFASERPRGGAPGIEPSCALPSKQPYLEHRRVYLPTMRKLTPDRSCRYRKFTQIDFTDLPVRVSAASTLMRLGRFAVWSEIQAGRAVLVVLRCSAMPQAAFHSTPEAQGCPTTAVWRLAWSEPGTGVAGGLHLGRCGIKPLGNRVDDGVSAGYVAAIPRNVIPWNGSAFQRLRGISGYFPTPRTRDT